MVGFLIRLVVNAVALLIVAYILPGVHVSSFVGALVAALVLGIVNAVLRPILVILTLPVVILTLGLFTLVINAITFYIVGHLGIGLAVDGFWSAFFGAIVLTIVSYLLSTLVRAVEAPPAT
ncbi:MAG: phage holin family protein [Candidatus Eremiobacteraeota bacterium]|jgi:putative membrane protein|nr:phage holin family protein [Candidatus Eremiobacteraeota bacterium]